MKFSFRWLSVFCLFVSTYLLLSNFITRLQSSLSHLQTANQGNTASCDQSLEEKSMTSKFQSDQPKFVVILSYQRSGSTYFSEFFNSNPEIFFLFEPVDSVYTAMYGTGQTFNVPSDITNYWNGSIRVLPDEELTAVSDFMKNFFSCDIENLRPEMLLTYYFMVSYDHKSSAGYIKCVRSNFRGSRYKTCEQFVTPRCGLRFGQKSEKEQNDCFRYLWKKEQPDNDVRKETRINFDKHRVCLAALRDKLKSKCEHLLLESCESRSIRVMKVVRATMDSMETMLRDIPNFRVIHLVRDPRAVALSRRVYRGNVLGTYSRKAYGDELLVREAGLYCSTVVRDIKTRQRLEKEYPGKIYSLLYDEMATDPLYYLQSVYKFLDIDIHNSTLTWLKSNEKSDKNNRTAEVIAKAWQDKLAINVNDDIVEKCREFYEIVKYNWTRLPVKKIDRINKSIQTRF